MDPGFGPGVGRPRKQGTQIQLLKFVQETLQSVAPSPGLEALNPPLVWNPPEESPIGAEDWSLVKLRAETALSLRCRRERALRAPYRSCAQRGRRSYCVLTAPVF